jgi:hypothetical protein
MTRAARPRSRIVALTSIHLLLMAFCWISPANAQAATATVSGIVLDESAAAVPRAVVSLINLGTALKRQTPTSPEGRFTLPLLPPGRYTLTAELSGFNTAQVPDLTLNVGDELWLIIRLRLAGVRESVTVVVEPPRVNLSPAVSTVVDRQFVENMPLNGRSFQSLITLTPGIVLTPVQGTGSFVNQGQFSVNGQRTDGNSFLVDGVSANFGSTPDFIGSATAQTSGNLPALTAFGTTQTLVSIDAMQEFRVQTSSYSAEYGRQAGGQISIVTRSGTNKLHGSLFNFLRNDIFDANNWFANRAHQPKPPEKQNDFGGTLGGPLTISRFYDGHNRTFFFFSYEGLQLREPRFDLWNVPTLALRQTAPAGVLPILNAFPLPNGRDLGNGLAEFGASFSDASSLNTAGLRIDHTINQNWGVFGRYSRAPSESSLRQASQVLTRHSGTQTMTFGLTAAPSSRVSHELRVNFSDSDSTIARKLDSFEGAVPPPPSALIPSQYAAGTASSNVFLVFPGRTATVTPGISVIQDHFTTSQRQFNLVAAVSYAIGSHRFKFGVDYRRLMPASALATYNLGVTFFSQQQVLNATADLGSVSVRGEVKPRYANFSSYTQDTWTLSPRLTLNLGMRWEVNPAPGEATLSHPLAVTDINNLATMRLAPTGTSQWKTTYNNFAPRFGAAYQVSQESGRETVARGGFGVFYDAGNNLASAGYTSGTYPFLASRVVRNIVFPLLPAQVAPPALPNSSGLTAPYPFTFIFDPNLRLPYTLQWNAALERALGKDHVLTLSYVGAAGRRLLQRHNLNLSRINPSFTNVGLTTNKATSDYNGLHVQFRRRLSRGLQALASYTWAHALDEDSTDAGWIAAVRGNAAFDIRHAFAAAITYDIPAPAQNRLAKAVLGHWSIDANFHARSAAPVDVTASRIQAFDPADGRLVAIRPNVVPGEPFYIDDPSVPGGRRINRAAFAEPAPGTFGNLGRNVVRGFGASQLDFGLRRQLRLSGTIKVQVRAEAFNIFNQPNFGALQTELGTANFGQATNMLNHQLGGLSALYQVGGPRSLQFALKIGFSK